MRPDVEAEELTAHGAVDFYIPAPTIVAECMNAICHKLQVVASERCR